MSSEERREKLVKILKESNTPLKGNRLAEMLDVSRQVIVQDIAIIRAGGFDIVATSQGYVVYDKPYVEQVIKCKNHTSIEEMYEELKSIIDIGGSVKDVIANHPTYGQIRAKLDISSNRELNEFMERIKNNEFKQLSTLTEYDHVHTIVAKNKKIIDEIVEDLKIKGMLS